MPSIQEAVGCRYRYDPLDRLVGTTPTADAASQRFYCINRFTTDIQDLLKRSIFQHGNQLLAQHQRDGKTVLATLLVTDQQRSVLNTINTNSPQPIAYSPYGHRPADSGLSSLLGFNGERRDSATGYYLLGNGYRAFNPVLMRFNSPDSWSPFGDGGLNPYTYCLGDPLNKSDETGHVAKLALLKGLVRAKSQLVASLTRARARLEMVGKPEEFLYQTYRDRAEISGAIVHNLRTTVSNENGSTHFTYPSGLQRNVRNTPYSLLESSYNATPGGLLQPGVTGDIPPIPTGDLNRLEQNLASRNYFNYMSPARVHPFSPAKAQDAALSALKGNASGVPPGFAEHKMHRYMKRNAAGFERYDDLGEAYKRALSEHQTLIRRNN